MSFILNTVTGEVNKLVKVSHKTTSSRLKENSKFISVQWQEMYIQRSNSPLKY